MLVSGRIVLARSLLLSFSLIVLEESAMLQVDFIARCWNGCVLEEGDSLRQ